MSPEPTSEPIERVWLVVATARVEYEVDAVSAEAAMAIVNAKYAHVIDRPTQVLDLISVEDAECYEETS
ncbi:MULTISPECIES: hypothetical protein [Glycomyces]|uniref:Uncharacterized protein n=2 Tax=Glycomyces TaxID=58113 RepID=A0ABU2AHV7_9ACTN|nr:hypothetical protein [Glycomyces lechevalierae]MDR7336801.1 hypothetical protein [Glycomyces lechevalierae]